MEREEKAKFQAVERKKQEERTKVALKNIVIKNDEMQRLKFYQHKDSPNYINSKSTLLPYFLVDDRGNAFLRLKNIYVSSDWLFIESYKIKADDKFFDIEVSYNDINHDNDSGEIWEWIDTLVSEDDLLMLKAIADSKGSKIRYIGKQYYKDREISEVEKKIIREVLLAFDEINKSLTGENK